MSNFDIVTEFENKVAAFFGAPFGVCVDSCTHGLELCLRLTGEGYMYSPTNTYLSIPFLAEKLDIELIWDKKRWIDCYILTPQIVDAAVLWRANSYLFRKYMCISFQYQKHLSLGRGGCILTDDKEAAIELKKMSYDGRLPGIPWREQNIDTIGYHYYMTPETAALGLQKLPAAIAMPPRIWQSSDYPDLTQMDVFKNKL